MIKKMTSFVSAIILFGACPAFAFPVRSNADLTNAPGVRTRENVDYNKYQTRSSRNVYTSDDGQNIYYSQPNKRGDLYKQYDNSRYGTRTTQTVRRTRSETVRREMKRKYFLAHPFFQPVGGKFGSVTDLSYSNNSFDITLNPTVELDDKNAKWNTDLFSVKEDFSYGISDRIAVVGMLKYDSSKYDLDWSVSPDDSMDDSSLNLFGLGLQWRFVDNEKWIATLSGYYQHQKDVSNNFLVDLKAGYKVSSSTIYGVVRGWYLDLNGDSYGNAMTGKNINSDKTSMFFAFSKDAQNVFFAEGGLGVFSVLGEDWTLNLEAVFGNYDWHSQASIKGAIGWQPNDWVALNLYGKASMFDNADDKKPEFYFKENDELKWNLGGTTDLNDYSELSAGLQIIFTF